MLTCSSSTDAASIKPTTISDVVDGLEGVCSHHLSLLSALKVPYSEVEASGQLHIYDRHGIGCFDVSIGRRRSTAGDIWVGTMFVFVLSSAARCQFRRGAPLQEACPSPQARTLAEIFTHSASPSPRIICFYELRLAHLQY